MIARALRRRRGRALPRGRRTSDGRPDAADAMRHDWTHAASSPRAPRRFALRLALTLAGVRRAGASRRACSRRWWAAHRSAWRACSTARSRSRTTSTRRSSSWRGCRACWPAPASAPRSRRPASCSRRMLRNPLATPFTLGVSAGASLGAMLAIVFGASVAVGPLSPVPLASLAGAAVASAIVYRLATIAGPCDVHVRAAARRRDAQLVLLGADHVRAVHRRLRRRSTAPRAG